MRSSRLLIGLLAVFSVVFFLACSDDDCGKTDCNENTTLQNVTFRGTSDGTEYVLKITQKAARSLRSTYQPQVGDSYVLTVNGKTSTGIVESIGQNGTLTLKPNIEQAATFTVQTSTNGLESITGTIRLDNGTTVQASGELEPKGSESGKENGNTGNGNDTTNTGGNGGNNDTIPTNHPIIGVWEHYYDGSQVYYEFKQNGTAKWWFVDSFNNGHERDFAYTIKGDTITLYVQDTPYYSISGDTLIVGDDEWIRVGSTSDSIVGTWNSADQTIEFRQDGTAIHTGIWAGEEHTMEFKYTTNNGKLIISAEDHSFIYSGGDRFTITDGMGSRIFNRAN